MQKKILLTLLAIWLSRCLSQADGLANNSTSPAVLITGGYAPMATNGSALFADPTEYWNNSWEEGTNGWRVQLRIYNQTNYLLQGGVASPFSTNLMLSVEWGSPIKNSGDGYYLPPNGKFEQFELLDADGNAVPSNSRFGNDLFVCWITKTAGAGNGITQGSNLPSWLSLKNGSLVADFPETVLTNIYPRLADTDQMVGEIWSVTNRPPPFICLSELADIYPVSKEGDYTLTIKPVLYKRGYHTDAAILDRMDLPAVTTKVHLSPEIRKIGDYSMVRGTDGYWKYVNPSEFWNGIWKEDTNGWRVQLRIYNETNIQFAREGLGYPVSTNLMLRVEWGSVVKNSGNGYFLTPNGKFAKFELLDANGTIIQPRPNSGTNLLENGTLYHGFKLKYGPHLPTWASPSNGSLEAKSPRMISTNVYPRVPNGQMAGGIESATNLPPLYVGLLKLDETYSIISEGDYTLTVQPVLYMQKSHNSEFLERVDLPSVTTKVHLVPNVK